MRHVLRIAMAQLTSDSFPYYDHILRYATRVTGSRDDGEDVAQEVCLRYIRSGKTYLGDQLRNYLYRMARNYIIDQNRRKKLHARVTADENSIVVIAYRNLFQSEPLPHQSVQDAETFAILHKKINQLPALKQEILHLRYDEKMKAKDIAEIVGLSYGNVRRILSETIAQLLTELEGII